MGGSVVRMRSSVLAVVVSVVAGMGLTAAPAVAGRPDPLAPTLKSIKGPTSMPAVGRGMPKATPNASPKVGNVLTTSAKSTPAISLSLLAASPDTYGDVVTLNAQVNLAKVAPGGTLRFTDGGVVIGSSGVDGTGAASMSTSTLRAGNHSLVAAYTVGATTVQTSAVGLSVAKRDLHLYAQPSRWSRPVGGTNPTFTVAVVTGNEGDLVNGETLATAVTGKPKFSLTAGVTSPPSVYPITLSGLKSANYNIVYRTAGFTVYTRDLVAGDMAPELTAPDQTGAAVSLSSLRGRVVLLDFSAVWCPPSQQLARDIPAIATKLAAKGIPFSYLPVLVDGPQEGVAGTQDDAQNFLNAFKLPTGTHVLHVDGSPVRLNQPLPAWSDQFHGYGALIDQNNGGGAYPTMAIIDTEGLVRYVTVGYGDGIDGLVSLLAEAGPDTGVQILAQPKFVTTQTTATIEFTTTGDVPAECSVDGGAFAACTSPFELTGLAVGDHQVAISIGGPWPAVATWSVIELDTFITGGPGDGFIPGWEFTGTGVGFVCWTGDETPYPCESGWGVFGIPGGLQTFHVAAVDEFGTVDDTPATDDYLFQPWPDITLVPSNPIPTGTETVTWTATVTDAITGDPVAGDVIFGTSEGIQSPPITLDSSGTATFDVAGNGFGYDIEVAFLGSADHGATSRVTHLNVAP